MANMNTLVTELKQVDQNVDRLIEQAHELMDALVAVGAELEASSVRMRMWNGLDATEFIRQTIAHVLGR